MRRRSGHLVIFLLVLLLGACGCQRSQFLATAVVSQGVPWRPERSRDGQWVFAGLDAGIPPRIRPGSYATATREVPFLDAADLGRHGYRFNWSERNGIIYTCRAGHIDIAHVRKAADCTGYLAAVVLAHMQQGRTQFQSKLIEPSVYHITLTYPSHWSSLDCVEQERIAREVSRDLGQHLAFTALTWHEIITWFGYRPRPYKSEFPSAFSWEDTYSNALGTQIGAAALDDPNLAFSDAATAILDRRIEELEGRPACVAQGAAELVRGQWYVPRWPETRIFKRNFDTGMDDGYITPCLVPSVTDCAGVQPQPLKAPTLDTLARHGFSMRLEMEPRVWEQKRILRVLKAKGCPTTKRLDPAIHFPLIIAYCEANAPVKGK